MVFTIVYTAGSDFVHVPESEVMVTFFPDENEITVRVNIIDDLIPESQESFLGKLVISCESAGFVQVAMSHRLATVIIMDNDGKC